MTKVHADSSKQPAAIVDIRVSQHAHVHDDRRKGQCLDPARRRSARYLNSPARPANGLQATVFGPKDDGVLAIGKNGEALLWKVNIPHPETTLQSVLTDLVRRLQRACLCLAVDCRHRRRRTETLDPAHLRHVQGGDLFADARDPDRAHDVRSTRPNSCRRARVSGVVKPTMELMATLPSVVGFVAALVLSPIVENWIAAIVIAFGVSR